MNPLNNINPNNGIPKPQVGKPTGEKVSGKFGKILGEKVDKAESGKVTKEALLHKIKEQMVKNLMNSIKALQQKIKEALD